MRATARNEVGRVGLSGGAGTRTQKFKAAKPRADPYPPRPHGLRGVWSCDGHAVNTRTTTITGSHPQFQPQDSHTQTVRSFQSGVSRQRKTHVPVDNRVAAAHDAVAAKPCVGTTPVGPEQVAAVPFDTCCGDRRLLIRWLARDQLRVLDSSSADQRNQRVPEQELVLPVVVAERHLVQVGL